MSKWTLFDLPELRHLQENFYHVLENVASSNNGVITSVPPAPLENNPLLQALPEATAHNTTTSILSNEIVGGNLAATNDSIGGNKGAQTHTIPVYAVPDKVRSKVILLCMFVYNVITVSEFSHT